MNFIRGSAVALMFVASTIAHPITERGSSLSSLGLSDWAHPSDHPVHRLFVRQNSSGAIGSEEWAAQYPNGNPTAADLLPAWQKVLDDAVAAGTVPDIPISNKGSYPGDVDGTDPEICSSTAQCRGEGDIWDSPDGILALSFDDGPTEVAPVLYEFLKENNQRVTHFMIGENIRENYESFDVAFKLGDDMAVHTWSHQYMTGLSNEEAFGQLAWTMQIIADLTGGRLPKYWRPPFGDSDNRIRAIAKLLGLTQVNWNQDTNDWELQTHKTTQSTITKNLNKWLTGPKSPGLNVLHHELDNQTVKAFIDNYPNMVSNGWDIRTVPQMAGTSYYINAADNTAEVIPMSVGGSAPGNVPAATGGNNDGGSGASSTPAASVTTTTTTTSNNNATNSASSLLGVSRSFIVGLVASVLCAQRLFS